MNLDGGETFQLRSNQECREAFGQIHIFCLVFIVGTVAAVMWIRGSSGEP